MLKMKVLILGDGAVGKTSLRHRYLGRGFQVNYMMTVGADFAVKELTFVDGTEVAMQIWDIAGQDLFKHLRSSFYQGAVGACIVFDVTRPETFENVITWIEEIATFHTIEYFPIILLGNKIDLKESIEFSISTHQGKSVADDLSTKHYKNQWNVPLIETSAKTGENVDEAFMKLSEACVKFYEMKKREIND
ncbi:MAG: Rab family GTPase [Candidatus Hodarchaeales archaeon]|jgi:small GTP-binding protein